MKALNIFPALGTDYSQAYLLSKKKLELSYMRKRVWKGVRIYELHE